MRARAASWAFVGLCGLFMVSSQESLLCKVSQENIFTSSAIAERQLSRLGVVLVRFAKLGIQRIKSHAQP
jgi:membrane protein YqaA with SNARE-associated domain